MEKNINSRLYRILFAEKSVTKDNSFYKKYYNYIWPCEKLFKDFIKSKDSSVKLDYAKKIFEYINLFDDVLLPSFAMNCVIKYQNTCLSESANKYFSQDHVIHTINTYILGVYFLFNHEIFNNKVLHNLHHSSFDEHLKNTIKMLRLFSIYHDIGYIFEGMIDVKGEIKGLDDIIKQYEEINNDIIIQYANKSTAKLLLLICLINNNTHLFTSKIIFNSNAKWELENGRILEKQNFINYLDNFQNYYYIDSIHTFQSYKKYFSPLQELETLIIVYDDKNYPISLITYKNNEINILAIIENNENKSIIKQLDKKEFYNNIKLKFFLKNPVNEIENIFKQANFNEYKDLNDFYRAIPLEIKSYISMVSNEQQLDDALYIVFSWMKKTFIFNGIKKPLTLSEKRNELLKEALKQNIKNEIDKYIDSKENLYKLTIKQSINKIAGFIKNVDANMIDEYASELSNSTDGIYEIINYYQQYYINYLEKALASDKCDFFYFERTKFVFYPFSHLKSNKFAENICSKLEDYAKDLNLSISDLKVYKTDYTICDHGIISSAMLFHVSTLYSALLEKNSNIKQILFSYNSNYFEQDNQTNIISTLSKVIFSILLHNIYTEEANKSYGLKYKHNININPFSYFCAFIDSMQKWDRPKQLDFSITNLPQDHYLNDNFDLEIIDNHILITCESSYAGKMRRDINNLESFLPGISSLITITESEM